MRTTTSQTLDQRDLNRKPMGPGWSIVSTDNLCIDTVETKALGRSSYSPTPAIRLMLKAIVLTSKAKIMNVLNGA